MATRVRLRIDEVVVSGLSPLEGRRLVDRLEGELRRIAPSMLNGNVQRSRARVDAGSVPASDRIERAATPIARAVAKAVSR
jgi:hypothetical protein